MKILILNWRDIKNPRAGGAEVLTHEMAKRWAAEGNEVTQISEYYKDAAKKDVIDGVKIIRSGTAQFRSFRVPLHIAAFWWYIKNGRGKFDVIVDEIHGIPFFTPLYVREKKVALICEVAREIWDAIFPFPLNEIGKFIEKYYFLFYRKTPFLTISESTRLDLEKQGIQEKDITVLPMGITVPKVLRSSRKEKKRTIIFVGRLTKAKGIEDAINALEILKSTYDDITLWVVGRGEEKYERYLKSRVIEKKLDKSIIFYGFVSQKEKFSLMSKAHILAVPSIKEGWGLIVPEAGFYKTPAVVYDVSGLRDIVTNNISGVTVGKNSRALAAGIKKLFDDTILYKTVQKGAFNFAKKQNWDVTAKRALQVLENE